MKVNKLNNMKIDCKNCRNLKNGDIILTKQLVKGDVCTVCGREMASLDWKNVPLYRKIIRYFKYPNK